MYSSLLATRDNGFTTGFSKSVRNVTSGDIITLANVKNWCRITTSDDDALLSMLIEAMIDMAEKYAGITLRRKEYTFEFQNYGNTIQLPYGPHVSIDAVRTKLDGTETTLDASDYFVTGQDHKTLNVKETFKNQQIEVDVTAGYGASDVPAQIQLALYKAVLSNYEDRQDLIGGTIVATLPNNSKAMLNQYKRILL